MVNNSIDYLRVCHVNCQSLLAHIDEFRSFFEGSGYHIICLSETWLRSSIPDSMVLLRGYHIVRQDRAGKTGGGVAVYLSDQLSSRVIHHSDDEYCRKPEYLMTEILTTATRNFYSL